MVGCGKGVFIMENCNHLNKNDILYVKDVCEYYEQSVY